MTALKKWALVLFLLIAAFYVVTLIEAAFATVCP